MSKLSKHGLRFAITELLKLCLLLFLDCSIFRKVLEVFQAFTMGLVRVLYILCNGDYLVSIFQPKGIRKLQHISVNRFYSRKLFFLSLKTFMTSAAEAFFKARPSASSGRLVLMKGLDIFSSPIVDGTVG